MGTLWRLWKKGFFLEVIVTIASLLLTFLGVGVLVLSNVIKDTSSITLIGLIICVVLFPIVRGFFMEKLERWIKR